MLQLRPAYPEGTGCKKTWAECSGRSGQQVQRPRGRKEWPKWRRGRGQCGWRLGKEGSEVGERRVVGRHRLPGEIPRFIISALEAILLWEVGQGTHLTQSGPAKFPLLGN